MTPAKLQQQHGSNEAGREAASPAVATTGARQLIINADHSVGHVGRRWKRAGLDIAQAQRAAGGS